VGSLDSLYVTFTVIQTVVLILAIRLLDPYEHEPLSLIGLMAVWGGTGAALLAWTWNARAKALLPNSVGLVFGSAITTPVVEEVAKGATLAIVFALAYWLHRRFGARQLGGVTDGIVYGTAIGLGFAFTEDVQYGLMHGIDALVARRNFFGYGALHHAIFTAAFGVGLGMVVWTKRRAMRVLWPIVGLLIAIGLHALNNGLTDVLLVRKFGLDQLAERAASGTSETTAAYEAARQSADRIASLVDYLLFLAVGLAVWLWLALQRRVITTQLIDEAGAGIVTSRDVELTPYYWRRQRRRWNLIRRRQVQRARVEEALHVHLARLAFAKWRQAKGAFADKGEVDRSRLEVARLKAEQRFVRLVGTPPNQSSAQP
jgi:RsiW-degrading membrane proteinase PrsW (M82 family)